VFFWWNFRDWQKKRCMLRNTRTRVTGSSGWWWCFMNSECYIAQGRNHSQQHKVKPWQIVVSKTHIIANKEWLCWSPCVENHIGQEYYQDYYLDILKKDLPNSCGTLVYQNCHLKYGCLCAKRLVINAMLNSIWELSFCILSK